MVFTTHAALIVSAFAVAISSVHAHINLSPKYAEPNQVLNTMFHVPHGCNGSSTVSISVTVPETITNLTARPVDKWTLATAYRDSSNASVSTITWSGGLLKGTDALDFPIILTVPNVDLSSQANVSFYFPVVQTCEVGSINWTSTSTAHGSSDGEPAPALIVVKNATQAAADALAIKGTASASAPAPTSTGNSGNQIYAGLLPVVAAIAALSISL